MLKEDLEAAGYDAMTLRDHQQSWFDSEVLSILQVPFAVLVIVVVLWLRLNSNDLKLFTAVVVGLFLAVPYLRGQRKSSFARLKKGGHGHA